MDSISKFEKLAVAKYLAPKSPISLPPQYLDLYLDAVFLVW